MIVGSQAGKINELKNALKEALELAEEGWLRVDVLRRGPYFSEERLEELKKVLRED